jgi:hypothetical protein
MLMQFLLKPLLARPGRHGPARGDQANIRAAKLAFLYADDETVLPNGARVFSRGLLCIIL